MDLEVRIEAGSDFADLFEVKDDLKKKGEYYTRVDDGRLVLGYRRETYVRETWVSATAACAVDEHGLTFKRPRRARRRVDHRPARDARARRRGPDDRRAQVRASRQEAAAQHGAQPREVARRGANARLRLGPAQADVPAQPRGPRGAAVLAGVAARPLPAGGRAALVHDHVRPRQHLHQPAGAALHAGAREDDARRARPVAGVAAGRLPRRGSGPHPPRAALRRDDRVRGAAALAVLRLGGRDAALRGAARRVRALDRRHEAGPVAGAPARAALAWIDDYADLQGNGYIAYQRRNEQTGLENQCWKDSWDSISYRDGRLPGFPRATCELQGYAYDAKVRGARLAREVWQRSGVRRQAGEGGGGPQAPLQPRLLGRGRAVLRARP